MTTWTREKPLRTDQLRELLLSSCHRIAADEPLEGRIVSWRAGQLLDRLCGYSIPLRDPADAPLQRLAVATVRLCDARLVRGTIPITDPRDLIEEFEDRRAKRDAWRAEARAEAEAEWAAAWHEYKGAQ